MTERRPVIIVHLGMHKTGTTSIQHFLARHRRRLREAGILYPRAGTHGEQHAALPASVLPTHPILPPALLDSDPALVIAAVDEEIRDAGVAVLSREVFWELLTFVAVLGVAYVYIWRKGALDWK